MRHNDAAARDFFDSTADVSEALADEREELATPSRRSRRR